MKDSKKSEGVHVHVSCDYGHLAFKVDSITPLVPLHLFNTHLSKDFRWSVPRIFCTSVDQPVSW